MDNKDKDGQVAMTSLGQQLSWIWLVCGLGLLFMGLSSQWNESAFHKPEDQSLFSHTGLLQQVTFHAPAKSPTVVEMLVYNKENGLKHSYLRYGYHVWEEQLKPYVHQVITVWVDKHQQVWQVQQGGQTLLSSQSIEQRLQSMKQAQQVMAEKIGYAGLLMVLLWLFFFRQRFTKKNHVYS